MSVVPEAWKCEVLGASNCYWLSCILYCRGPSGVDSNILWYYKILLKEAYLQVLVRSSASAGCADNVQAKPSISNILYTVKFSIKSSFVCRVCCYRTCGNCSLRTRRILQNIAQTRRHSTATCWRRLKMTWPPRVPCFLTWHIIELVIFYPFCRQCIHSNAIYLFSFLVI